MSKAVLITGASGFIGSYVLKEFLRRGVVCDVTVRNASEVDKLKRQFGNVRRVHQIDDLFTAKQSDLAKLCENVDTVLHLAWYVKHEDYKTSDKNIDCLLGTIKLAFVVARSSVTKFVGIGSCLEYAPSTSNLAANSPLLASNLYSLCKIQTSASISEIFAHFATKFAWLRLFYLFGDGESDGRLVPTIHKQLSRGQQLDILSPDTVIDMMHVESAAFAIADLVLGSGTGTVNICSGKGVKIKDIALEIASQYERKDLIKCDTHGDADGKTNRIVGIPTKAS
jgi:nucleoside-diphosphate-sugar epimerase